MLKPIAPARFTLTVTQLGPYKRVGYRDHVDTQTGEIVRVNIVEHCRYGRWLPGLPPKPLKGSK